MIALDAVIMIVFQATPSGRHRFCRMADFLAASSVGADALHRCFPRALTRTNIGAVLATASNVITL